MWRKLEVLEIDPRPRTAVKLIGEEGAYRIRVGDYRVVFLVNDGERIVEVIRVAHRRDVYR
jgi:mRNA interferase RelE/StbE